MRWRGWAVAVLVILGAAMQHDIRAGAAGNAPGAERRVQLDLLSDKRELEPGGTLTLAVRQTIEPGWHTYWINPGDSGEPTTIEWTLPAGFEAAPFQWPVPQAIPTGPLTSFGYEGTVLLLSTVKVPQTLPDGPVTIAGKVRYLVCKDICIPEDGDVSVTFGGDSKAPAGAIAIERARRDLPIALPGTAEYSQGGTDKLVLAATLTGIDLSRVKSAHFFPYEWGTISNPAPQILKVNGDSLRLELTRGELKTTPPELRGVLALAEDVNGVERRQGFELAAKLTSSAAAAPGKGADASSLGGNAAGAAGPVASFDGAASVGGMTLLTAAVFAFLGGLILNLMPCVFPVLALKALSFAGGGSRAAHTRNGFAYLGGVMASFVVFAGALLFLRETGSAMGWGFQFQSPEFVLGLAALFFVLGLSLSGVFTFGGGLMAVGDSLARKPGSSGYFFTGVLAAVAATPCTAPFMGAAIGYAVSQPPAMLLTVFLALGIGFALPVLLLSLSPAFQRIMPKPGAWMETFKQVMAFPLYATAGWLVWVLSIQAGSDGVMAAVVALTGVAFAAWLAGRTAMSSLPARVAAPALAVAAMLFAFTLTPAENVSTSGSAAMATENGAGPKAEIFTAARLDQLVQAGQPVFINFTAAWCITCKVNERVALASETVADAFSKGNITYLIGDWTRQNPEITAVLQRFGRAGVPLYLFYPGKGQEPRVLPQLLTEPILLEEIKGASASTPATTKGA
jgi:thiol:disulfide interchange protein DsbD